MVDHIKPHIIGITESWANTMADGKKNRCSALAGKDKCDETESQLFEQTVAEAVEEALNNEKTRNRQCVLNNRRKERRKPGPPQPRRPRQPKMGR